MARKILQIILVILILITAVASQPARAGEPFQPDGSGNIPGGFGNGDFGKTVTALPNGNFVVTDPAYSLFFKTGIGAVYLYSGLTHQRLNVATGTQNGDHFGSGGVVVLAGGDYVVISPDFTTSNGVTDVPAGGAVTLCSAVTGCPDTISGLNSLVGGRNNDHVGSQGVKRLVGGGYVVSSMLLDNGVSVDVGVVTACPASGCVGFVYDNNSLAGTHADDRVGSGGVTPLPGGSFLVSSPVWDNGAVKNVGALTHCLASGCNTLVAASNSLVGAGADESFGYLVTILAGGGYVARSPFWNGIRGAVIACPANGCAPGPLTTLNSLTGSQPNDSVGGDLSSGGITVLNGGGFVVSSPYWSNGAILFTGAVTACPASGCGGEVVSASNSLVGSSSSDNVGVNVDALVGGGYVVASPGWTKGAVAWTGAVTACPAAGCTGAVSTANSLTGSQVNDSVGGMVMALAGGGFIVGSSYWSAQKGAATACPAVGCAGMVVSAANSLVGSQAGDLVGHELLALKDGSYAVGSPYWSNGTGAATHCPAAGCKGALNPANSLVGSQANDEVGKNLVGLGGGQYLVSSPYWNNGAQTFAGAVTLCPAAGCVGVVSAANSLVGSHTDDQVGFSILVQTNGEFIISSPSWDNGALSDAGAFSLCRSTLTPCVGPVSSANGVTGGAAAKGANLSVTYDTLHKTMIVGRPDENMVSYFTYQNQLYLPFLKR